MQTITTIGISGQSGAGKSSLCKDLLSSLSSCNLIHQDWYFKPIEELSGKSNFCELDCLNINNFVSDILALINGKTIIVRTLDLDTFEPNGIIELRPKKFLLVEGMTIFRIPDLRSAFDISIYIDPGIDELIYRKLIRDLTARQKSVSEVLFQLSWLKREYRRDMSEFIQGINVIEGNIPSEALHDKVMKLINIPNTYRMCYG
jgi:uridine kinase